MGLLLGLVLGFILNLAWYFFTLIVFGYGHIAPEWYIEVHKWIEKFLVIFSIILCLIASQWFYYYYFKKGKDKEIGTDNT